MSLFPQSPSSRSASANLAEFRAGRMNLNGTTVTADARKGLVFLVVKPDDQLLHFCWKDRTSGALEEDLILFPEDAEWKRVPQCTTGRVFLLRFKDSGRKIFFWLQEPKTDKDDELFERVNKILSSANPASLATAASSSSSSSSGSASAGGSNANNPQAALLARMGLSQDQIDRFLEEQRSGRRSARSGGRTAAATGAASPGAAATSAATSAAAPAAAAAAAAPAAAPAAAATAPSADTSSAAPSSAAAASNPVPMDTSSIGDSLAQALAMMQQQPPREQLSLTQIVTPDALSLLLSNNDVVQQLLPHLPEGVPHTAEELRATARSPQFHQALQALTAALQSGNLNAVMSQFGIDPSLAGTAQGVEAFLQALQRSRSTGNSNNQGSQ